MLFQIGPWTYRVKIVPELFNSDGEPLMGRCDQDSMSILIHKDVSPAARLSVVLHEVRHAWQWHVPRPRTAEEEADLSATVTAAAMRDLSRQGGVAALMALRMTGELASPPKTQPTASEGLRYVPIDTVEPFETRAPARAGRAQCGVCEMIVADGSIVTGKPWWDDEAKGVVVTRTLYCAHCGHLQTWDEGSNNAGIPNGAVVRGPSYLRGEAVDSFLAEHPEAAGLLAG